eukprot:3064899-Lingulodinium_polyedra.AAC.1
MGRRNPCGRICHGHARGRLALADAYRRPHGEQELRPSGTRVLARGTGLQVRAQLSGRPGNGRRG